MTLWKQSQLAATLLFSITALASPNAITSNDDSRDNLSITIYNQSLALINESRHIPFKAGLNEIEFKHVSAQIRAETALLTSLTNADIKIIEQNFDYDLLTPQALLNKAVGQDIEIIKTNPETGTEVREKAKLLSNNGQPVLQFKDRIEIGPFDSFAFTSIPAGLRDSPTLSVLINSQKNLNDKVQLTYLTGGFSWQADYTATLSKDEKTLDLSGLITLNNNSGTNFKNAQLQLVAGNVNQVQQNYGRMQKLNSAVVMAADSYTITSDQFADYHLYKIPFTTTLNNNQTKQVSLLSAQKVPVAKEYIFNQFYNYVTLPNENLKASVRYQLNNKKSDNLGLPLPKGTFRIYKNDSTDSALFVGEDSIQHTAENESFAVTTGQAFDVSLTKQLTQRKIISKDVTQFTYEVVFNNAKNEDVTVSYQSQMPDAAWQVINPSQALESSDASSMKWAITIPAKKQTTLIYTVQVTVQDQ